MWTWAVPGQVAATVCEGGKSAGTHMHTHVHTSALAVCLRQGRHPWALFVAFKPGQWHGLTSLTDNLRSLGQRSLKSPLLQRGSDTSQFPTHLWEILLHTRTLAGPALWSLWRERFPRWGWGWGSQGAWAAWCVCALAHTHLPLMVKKFLLPNKENCSLRKKS